MRILILITTVVGLAGCKSGDGSTLPPAGSKSPLAYAQADRYRINPGEEVCFVDYLEGPEGMLNRSYDPDGRIRKWEWDFSFQASAGFMPESVIMHPCAEFPQKGFYHVQLRVTDNSGNSDLLDAPLIIVVGGGSFPPVALAKMEPLIAMPGQPVHFWDIGSYDPDGGDITAYEWDWDLDGIYDEKGADVRHEWIVPGTYLVQYRVTDDEGENDILDQPLSLTITTVNVPPVAIAAADYPVAERDQPIHFHDNGSHDPDGGSIVKYEWDWDNDGIFDEEGRDAYHSWPESGKFHVQFRVTDDESATDMLDQPLEITINPERVPPVAIAQVDPLSVYPGEQMRFFDDGSYDPDGGLITRYEWDWDNDGIFDEEGAVVYHSWTDPGEYQVQFRVTDDEGKTDTLDEPLLVIIKGGAVIWARRDGGDQSEFSQEITVLPDNSIVVAGKFAEYVTLGDGDPNEITLYSEGSVDLWVAKYGPDGSLEWARSDGGMDGDYITGMAAFPDNSLGVTGSFTDSTIFGKGELNETELVGNGLDEIFIARYNPDGTLAWVKSAGGTHSDHGSDILVLEDYSIYVTGYCAHNAVFGEGEPNETRLTQGYDTIMFIAHYNPDGTLDWVKGANGDHSTGRALAAFINDSVLVCGTFQYTVTFGKDEPNETTFEQDSVYYDAYIARYNHDGSLIWARQHRSNGAVEIWPSEIEILSDNSIVMLAKERLLYMDGAAMIMKLDMAGNVIWRKTTISASSYGYEGAVLSDDSIVYAGWFNTTITFNQGESDEITLKASKHNNCESFISRYEIDGSLTWARRLGGLDNHDGSFCNGIAVLADDSIAITGYFENLLIMGEGQPFETHLESVGETDIYIARFTQ